MFFDYRSNSINSLSEAFLDLLASKKYNDPFEKNWIIIQNKEMQQWITLQEADHNSISANNEFIFPSEFLWKLYRLKNPELPKYLPSDRIPLQWSVFEVISNDDQLLSEIISKDFSDKKHLLQLSKSISDVFDLYQVYRPELIQKWESGRLVYNISQEKWQAKLWKKISVKWEKKGDKVTRVDAFKDLCNWIKSGSFPISKIPENIWIFSLPRISKPFSKSLGLLSKHVDIHNFGYSFNVDKSTESELSLSKKVLRSHFDNKEVLNESISKVQFETKDIKLTEKEGSATKLEALQSFLRGKEVPVFSDKDSSIQIHSCHNKRREVELLKDILLNSFDKDPELSPEDCLVLVPNLEDYHLILKDIFSKALKEPAIPVAKVFDDSSSIRTKALLKILNALTSDFKVNTILELIENPVLSAKWKFDESDISKLRDWAVELRIHREIEGSIFSWFSALDKLFLGFTMEADKFSVFQDRSVYTSFITKESSELIARTSSFLSLLKKETNLSSRSLTIKDWLKKVQEIVGLFLLDKYDQEFNVQKLINELKDLEAKLEPLDSKKTISFELFLMWFKENIAGSASSVSGFGHGININEYVPNRNIPYKFVAILGLSEGTFPVSTIRPEYDLIHRFPTKGDRIEQHEQRYLFFDMIQSAKDKLHISYLRQNSRTNSNSSPSTLVQELIESCSKKNIQLEIETHRLHGFEEEYFSNKSLRLLSYSERRRTICENILLNKTGLDSFISADFTVIDQESTVSANDLTSFFAHPVKAFCKNVLGISNYEDIEDPDDREQFETKELNKYFLKEFLQDAFFENLDESEMRSASFAAGLLPEGFPGELDFASNMNLIRKLSKVKEQFDLASKESKEIEIELPPYNIEGSVNKVINDTRLDIRLGKLKGKNILDLWINHLILNYDSNFKSQLFYFDSNENLKSLTLTPELEEQNSVLSSMLDFYYNAHQKPEEYIFPAETSFTFAKTLFKTKSEDKAVKAAGKKWDSFEGFSDSDDYYNSLMFKNGDFIKESVFQKSSKELWFPILKEIGDIE